MSLVGRWLVVLLLVPSGLAHATDVATEPELLTGLPEPPDYVRVHFSEALVPERSVMAIFDNQALRRDTGNSTIDPDDPRVIRLYTGNLIPGLYTISYDTVSAVDGHLERGSIPMTIGVPFEGDRRGPDLYAVSAVDPPPAETAARWLADVGVALLVGAVVWQSLAGHRAVDGRFARAARIQVGLGALLGLAGGFAALVLHARTGGGLLPWHVARVALVAATVAMWWVAARPRPARRAQVVMVASATTLAALTSLLGHGMRSPWEGFLHVTHAVAMFAWIGGLPLAVFWLAWPGPRGRLAGMAAFSRVATTAIVVLVVTAVALTWTRLQSPRDLWTTGYGVLLLIKAALAAAMLALGAWNHRAIHRRQRVHLGRPEGDRMRRRVQAEAALAVVVLVATAVLASGTAVPADRPPPPGVWQQEGWWGDYLVTVSISPVFGGGLQPGDHTVTAAIRDLEGRPLPANTVTFRFQHQVLDLGAITAPAPMASPGQPGVYEVRGNQLASLGPWRIDVLFAVEGREEPMRAWVEVQVGNIGHLHGGVKITDPHWDTGYLDPGGTFERLFTAADIGRFQCHCHAYQWMECEITVDPEAPPVPEGLVEVRIQGDRADSAGAYHFEPAEVRIPPGTAVRWINDADIRHTATNVQWYPLPEE